MDDEVVLELSVAEWKQEQRGFLRCLLNTHNECAMHVHNHPQVVAHNFTHEYIRVCCVLWGFPYTDAII